MTNDLRERTFTMNLSRLFFAITYANQIQRGRRPRPDLHAKRAGVSPRFIIISEQVINLNSSSLDRTETSKSSEYRNISRSTRIVKT